MTLSKIMRKFCQWPQKFCAWIFMMMLGKVPIVPNGILLEKNHRNIITHRGFNDLTGNQKLGVVFLAKELRCDAHKITPKLPNFQCHLCSHTNLIWMNGQSLFRDLTTHDYIFSWSIKRAWISSSPLQLVNCHEC